MLHHLLEIFAQRLKMRRNVFKIAKWFLLGVLALLVIVVSIGLSYRAYRQQQYEPGLAIHTSNGIQEGRYVTVGGIEQWIQIRGEDRNNPVLLFVHGGPGIPSAVLTAGWQPWEKYFTVVHWDERGAGRTFRKSRRSVALSMNLERMTQDGVEITEFLRTYLHKDKVLLVGQSWGSILGIHMIKKRPDLFSAYVGTAQFVNTKKAYPILFDHAMAMAKAANNREAINALAPMKSSLMGFRTVLNWRERLALASGEYIGPTGSKIHPLYMPDYSILDFLFLAAGHLFSREYLEEPIDGPVRQADLPALGLDFAVPVFFFQGTEDQMTPIELVEPYFEQIKAPHKEFVPFEGEHHFLIQNRPDEFLKELLNRVHPLISKSF